MTTLAQTFLETPFPVDLTNEQLPSAWRIVYNTLTNSNTREGEEPFVAERFVFDYDMQEIAKQTLPQLGDGNIIYQTAQLPCSPLWLEWKNFNTKEGVLLFEFEGKIHAFLVMQYDKRHAMPWLCLRMPVYPLPSRFVTLEILWRLRDNNGEEAPEVHRHAKRIIGIVTFALFLLSVPRVSELVEIDFDQRLQRKRQKCGKLPLFEFKQVKLHLSSPQKRYVYTGKETAEEREAIRRRLHQVIGHFRTYSKNREKPRVTYIPPHWRGDPELGMVLHERTVIK